jgi:hypothetical protein
MLMHHADALSPGIQRGAETNRASVNFDVTGVRLVQSGYDSHQ